MRFIFAIAAIVAAYLGYQHYDNETRQNAFIDILDTINRQPINQFELKLSLNTQVEARCQAIGKNETNLAKYTPLAIIGIPSGTSPQIWQLKKMSMIGGTRSPRP